MSSRNQQDYSIFNFIWAIVFHKYLPAAFLLPYLSAYHKVTYYKV